MDATDKETEPNSWRETVVERIEKKYLKWFGHLLRQPDGRQPKRMFIWKPQGNRKRGNPTRCWSEGIHEVGVYRLEEEQALERDVCRWRTKKHQQVFSRRRVVYILYVRTRNMYVCMFYGKQQRMLLTTQGFIFIEELTSVIAGSCRPAWFSALICTCLRVFVSAALLNNYKVIVF